ncbi:MAG: Smr/MutS family protein [Myxococcales bacterium]|nr:Smr/MutS family protein [Myxococcales bacterium]
MTSERAALHHLGWIDICEHLQRLMRTPLGRARLETILEEDLAGRGDLRLRDGEQTSFAGHRSADVATLRRRFEEIDDLEAALARSAAAGSIGESLGALVDVTEAIGGARHGARLGAGELAGVRDLLRAIAAILDVCGGGAAGPALARRIDVLAPCTELRVALDRAIGAGPEGEAIVLDGASPALGRARQRIRDQRARLIREAEGLLRDPGVREVLRDRFYTEREGRVVLPIRADAFSQASTPGIIHDSSSSGGTLFVEPSALIQGNNALREAHLGAAAEERRILEGLSRDVGAAADALLDDLRGAVVVDGILARLRLSQAIGGRTPKVAEARAGATLRLPGMRHPLLHLAGVDVVANDFELAVGAAMIISGPNAGGKTVALKTVGVCVLLAQAGIRPPTSAPAEIPIFREVVTDVGDDQSIFANLSTFSAHIAHVREALARAEADGPGTLVLLDEIAVGTDPEQGAALAEAILHHLARAGASAVITTHYERLKELAGEEPGRFVNAAVGFDIERMAPTFRVTIGVPGPSSAFAVARRLGLPESLLVEAEAHVAEARRSLDELLLQVNAEREALAALRSQLEAERAEISERLESARTREAAALAKARSRKQKAYDEAAVELRGLRQEVKELRKRVRAEGDGEAIVDGRRGERELRDRLHEQREPSKRAPGGPPRELAVGDSVLVATLDREGEVVAIQGSKVTVLIGGLRTTVALADLRQSAAAAEPEPPRTKIRRQQSAPIRTWAASTASRHFGAEPAVVERSVDNVVDLRGSRADEAIRALDRFIDQALLADQEVVLIQHGHGSGALRQSVREHLRTLGCVRELRPGLPREGGDGATIVWLDA